jgi:maltose alpha-D-glucosyltransferase / alpha-amylase
MIDDLWYKNAIVYSLDLETFMDSNGDGVGDFEGLVRRLDYLEALGVDVLWLAPFQCTPNRDNGYDISDYYGVDPRHGSAGDFVELMHQAKKRGFRVIIDLVVNHTSDQHRWFQEARQDPQSPYRDWYVWSPKRPPDWDTGMVFPGVQKATWTRDEKAGAYYFHRFYEHQPDLNFDNPAVRREVRRIAGFWLELGVDGFRLDAVPFLIEHPRSDGKHGRLRFEYLEELRAFTQWRAGNSVLLGEANVLPRQSARYFAAGRGLHLMFNFWVNQHLFFALASGAVAPLAKALEMTRELPPTAQWAHFLRNHDELDLGRLKEPQRQLVLDRFGPDPDMQLYGRGIRRRLAPMLGNRAHLELAYSLLFALPGTPVLRYGDEVGMGEDLSLDERDAVRTPMQWSAEPGAGFSTATKLVHPLVDEGPFGYRHVNVEDQKRDPDSLLRWTGRMIRLRKETPEIGWGSWRTLDSGSPHVLALAYEWRGNTVLTVHNFADSPREVRLRWRGDADSRLLDLIGYEHAPRRGGRYVVTLQAHGYRWFRPAGRDPLLQSADSPSLAHGTSC